DGSLSLPTSEPPTTVARKEATPSFEAIDGTSSCTTTQPPQQRLLSPSHPP
ncbi:hypothetical protein A2U01_0117507, partial [Trifolium medium]|nr:hypothetical protein [Trifolium medium]